MARYTMHFYLDNGDVVSTSEIEATSYDDVFKTFYRVGELGIINIEMDTDSIFIPVNKISKIKITNDTEVEKNMGVSFMSF